MGEILKTWLRTRLGVIIDLNPETFGHYTKDGTLLAKLLHSYDIINDSQLKTIIRTQDPALCRVNLKHLRLWLKFIGVDCKDDCIEEISTEKGTTSARLFFKVFLCLENKDRLHFITLQKEREKYIPTSTKFDVSTVQEEAETGREVLEDHPFSKPLLEGAETISWYQSKLLNPKKKEPRVKEPSSRCKEDSMRGESRTRPGERGRGDAEDVRGTTREEIREDVPYETMFPKGLKARSRREATSRELKTRMQKVLLSDLWERLLKQQERHLDLAVAEKVLTQSRYEKQLIEKLCRVREQKVRISRNRLIVEELITRTKEGEAVIEQDRSRETSLRDAEDVDAECRRLCELRKMLKTEKMRKVRERHEGLCAEVLKDLVDLSLEVSRYRSQNENEIPESLWREWRSLFLKSQPMVQHLENLEDLVEQRVSNSSLEEIQRIELGRQNVLDEADFENYHRIKPPWEAFSPGPESEERQTLLPGEQVLGYVVHTLLRVLYPYPKDPESPPLPRFSTSAVVLGLSPELRSPLQGLLEKSGILLVRLEDAINFCLSRYKEEMRDSRFIDLEEVAEMNKGPGRVSEVVGSKRSGLERGSKRLKESARSRMVLPEEGGPSKQTQTPRQIPFDDLDPTLTDAAYMGRWAHEFLTLGQPVSSELGARVLMEYLKSLEGVEGFALLDYPMTYEQMSCLEFSLSGLRVPPEEDVHSMDENIEDFEPPSSRISFEVEDPDRFENQRQSRLLPNPVPRLAGLAPKSLVSSFVRVLPKPEDVSFDERDLFEVLPEDATAMDAFYAGQGTAYVLYYSVLDLPTLKRLARMVLGDPEFPPKPSEEIFRVPEYPLGGETEVLRSKRPISKRVLPRPESKESLDEVPGEMSPEESQRTLSREVEPERIDPGDPGWKWAAPPSSPRLLESLAKIWEAAEEVYVEDLKSIFFVKRINHSTVVPYKDFVKKHMKEFVERPDNKQDLLHEFHVRFNAFQEDVRQDEEVKCELHCRVGEFQDILWEVCDRRRKEAEEERRRIVLENWTLQEAIVLGNLFISMVQAELDRHVDTMQLVQDYYSSSMDRPLSQNRFKKILLPRIDLQEKDPEERSLPASPAKSGKGKESRGTKKGSSGKKDKKSSAPAGLENVKDEVLDLLMSTDREEEGHDQNGLYRAVHSCVQKARHLVDSIAETLKSQLKKEEAAAGQDSAFKGKVASKGSGRDPNPGREDDLRTLKRNVILEWRTAANFETNRVRLRLKILDLASRSDLNLLLNTMREMFREIHEEITSRYHREMKNVNELTSVFCFAIEEARPIQEEMLLDGDRFIVRSNVLMFPDKPRPPAEPVLEENHVFRFRMAQLGRLMDVFKNVAPGGKMSERAFSYILMDLVARGLEEGEVVPLPGSWYQLDPEDVEVLVLRLFGDETRLDWRDFVIYAMELPMPSANQILDARDAFRVADPEEKELVSREQFLSTPLWFYTCSDAAEVSRCILHGEFQRDSQDLYPEEVGPEEGEGLSRVVGLDSEVLQRLARRLRCDEDAALREVLRLLLAKEVLCDMYSVDGNFVNYTEVLLAFCKDDDPKRGLGKAFSLALGNPLCTDDEEGERYVERLLLEKRLLAEVEACRNRLHEEALEVGGAIVEQIVEAVVQEVEGLLLKELDKLRLEPDFGYKRPILIQSLDEPRVVDPAELLADQDVGIPEEVSGGDLEESSLSVEPESTSSMSSTEIEASRSLQHVETQRDSVFWIHRKICIAVLATLLPHLAVQDYFQSSRTLRGQIDLVYQDLKDEELNDDEDLVLSHRLVNHSFIKQLLANTGKFGNKNIGGILREVLQQKERTKRTLET